MAGQKGNRLKMETIYDVAVIGAGVTGCAAARYISRYNVKAIVIERAEDVCAFGASKANSAIVHAGFDAPNGSLMARLNVEGSKMMGPLSKELDFDYKNNGSLVVCMKEEDYPKLERLYQNGIKNGVDGLEIVRGERLFELEGAVRRDAYAALWAPTGAIVCPFSLTIALAENAAMNGVSFKFNSTVTALRYEGGAWSIQTNRGLIRARSVINAAGVYADTLHNMVSSRRINITPRKGEYMLLDKSAGGFIKRTVFQLPDKLGKGVLVSPTVHGNVIVGPTALDVFDRDGVNTTSSGLAAVMERSGAAVENVPLKQVITSFAGLRAHEDGHEFIIGLAEGTKSFFDCAGIESPGLSSAPAIGKMIADMVAESLGLEENKAFEPKRQRIINPRRLTNAERNALIAQDGSFGQIVCRCEGITEGEIISAIRRPIGAKSLDGVKRRVRAGMGRCQGGFCGTRVMEILARELNISINDVTKCGGESKMIMGSSQKGDIRQ